MCLRLLCVGHLPVVVMLLGEYDPGTPSVCVSDPGDEDCASDTRGELFPIDSNFSCRSAPPVFPSDFLALAYIDS